ncbi:MAG: hypothetical protein V4692_14415, partial [Bdellovibrionota bacterium]
NRLFESQMPGKLSAIAKAIRAGDQLVLVSKFENPNLAPVQFANYLRRQAAKQKRALPPTILPENAKTVSELPKLDTLGLIEEISALPTLAGLGERHIQRIKDLMTWPVRYSRVCLNSHCANPDRLTEGLEIQTVFRVESADFEVTLKQERQLEKWNGQVQPNPKANLNQRIECI